jgi:hypothetical protein
LFGQRFAILSSRCCRSAHRSAASRRRSLGGSAAGTYASTSPVIMLHVSSCTTVGHSVGAPATAPVVSVAPAGQVAAATMYSSRRRVARRLASVASDSGSGSNGTLPLGGVGEASSIQRRSQPMQASPILAAQGTAAESFRHVSRCCVRTFSWSPPFRALFLSTLLYFLQLYLCPTIYPNPSQQRERRIRANYLSADIRSTPVRHPGLPLERCATVCVRPSRSNKR